MAETVEVTIGMPLYNGAAHVEDAIRSLLGQTEPHFFLRISDNCSTDETPEICMRLAAEDGRISYVRQERNLGAPGNFEYLLSQAATPFFMWAAHDDLWDPEFLAVSLELLRAAPSAVGSIVGHRFVDAEGRELRRTLPAPDLASPDPVRRARATRSDGHVAIYGLLRREKLPAGLRLPEFPLADYAYVYALSLHAPFAVTPRVLKTIGFTGYDFVELPDGRLVYEKALGPDGHLYSRNPGPAYRWILTETLRSPLRAGARARLVLHASVLWWREWRALVRGDSAQRAKRALDERRYGQAALHSAASALAGPLQAVSAARRRLPRL